MSLLGALHSWGGPSSALAPLPGLGGISLSWREESTFFSSFNISVVIKKFIEMILSNIPNGFQGHMDTVKCYHCLFNYLSSLSTSRRKSSGFYIDYNLLFMAKVSLF